MITIGQSLHVMYCMSVHRAFAQDKSRGACMGMSVTRRWVLGIPTEQVHVNLPFTVTLSFSHWHVHYYVQ